MTDRNATREFEQLLDYLKQTRGVDVGTYRLSTLATRIDKRLAAVGAASYDEYIDHLEVHPDEFGHLFNAILIDATTFFRDAETFDYLRHHVIPALLASKPERDNIRVWSAGCASGEECYSIAMLLAEALGAPAYLERVKIYATDVDEEELALARRASYSEQRMEHVPPELRARYFDCDGSHWLFKKDFRRTVIFGRHDLLDDAPISKVDMLICRNTLMYFNEEVQAKILSRFRIALREGGYLVLGRAELPPTVERGFSPVNVDQRVFARTPDGNAAGPSDASRADLLHEIDRLRRELHAAHDTIRALQTPAKR